MIDCQLRMNAICVELLPPLVFMIGLQAVQIYAVNYLFMYSLGFECELISSSECRRRGSNKVGILSLSH